MPVTQTNLQTPGHRHRYYGYRPYGYGYGYRGYRPNYYLYDPRPYLGLSLYRAPYYHGYYGYRPYGYGRYPYGHGHPYGPRHGNYGPVVYEKKTYPISFATLQRIASAQEVKIRLVGRFFVHRYFTDKNFEIFQRFVDESAGRYSEQEWMSM